MDFAVFCTYKYLNSGAGSIGGVFVHSQHFDKEYPHFDGWWGNQDNTRFQMKPSTNRARIPLIMSLSLFKDIERGIGANGFRISNPSIHHCATLAASLSVGQSIPNNFKWREISL